MIYRKVVIKHVKALLAADTPPNQILIDNGKKSKYMPVPSNHVVNVYTALTFNFADST